jgi:hypothetical protein
VVGRICGDLLLPRDAGLWFMNLMWTGLLLLVFDVVCEGGQKLGAVGADDEGCRVGAAVDDEVEQVGWQGRREEEGLCMHIHCKWCNY